MPLNAERVGKAPDVGVDGGLNGNQVPLNALVVLGGGHLNVYDAVSVLHTDDAVEDLVPHGRYSLGVSQHLGGYRRAQKALPLCSLRVSFGLYGDPPCSLVLQDFDLDHVTLAMPRSPPPSELD